MLIKTIVILINLFLSWTFLKHALLIFQQNHYELKRYQQWLFDKNNLHYNLVIVYYIVIILIDIFFKKIVSDILILLISLGFGIYLFIKEKKKQYIKPLVFTKRVYRQLFVSLILMTVVLYLLYLRFPMYLISFASILLAYVIIYPMALICLPIEYLIKKYYENLARNILKKNDNLLKIGITGSYGKTSTKNIINDIISEKYYTLITPASFNTPMGITRTIREMLKPIHQVFVCEMGADKINDISYLMDFVKPSFGVVSSIGPQHLNTFGSIDNIVKEKMKEIEMLPKEGVGFLNYDNQYIRNYQIKNKCKIITVGIENKNVDYHAEDIKYSKDGSSFSVVINSDKYDFKTCLLGQHNITNLLLAIAIAIELKIDIADIVKYVQNVNQVEHRLQIKKINGFTFIDDAFNANPQGSKMALEVLKLMPGKRVIVTPGMIDLGSKQDEINYEFGKYMKDRADFVILVGEKQTMKIYEGLLASEFGKDSVIISKNINEAFDYVYANFGIEDTILLENDLPDAFNK